MVEFTQRAEQALNTVLSTLIDNAFIAHVEAEYEAGRGSGIGMVAKKRIGAGYAGTVCTRALAYRYHQYPKVEPNDESNIGKGELHRHAAAGHWTETKTAEWMRLAGFTIETTRPDGKQIGWAAAADPINGQFHMAGEIDGVITGVPHQIAAMIPIPSIWESKKATAKKWAKFYKDSVHRVDPVYYSQLQLNMAYLGIMNTLFSILNLDTMKYHFELVGFDERHAQRISDRALEVIQSERPEQFIQLGKGEDDFVCKFCQYKDRCWHPAGPVAQLWQPPTSNPIWNVQ